MSLKTDFAKAQQDVKELSSLDSQNLLKLYSLYKQSSKGDVSGKRPGMLDLKGRAKFDAWSEVKGTSQDDAMQQYIALVKKLLS